MINIVYIAGPMRGYENFNYNAFMNAEALLREEGFKVLNPACLPNDLPEDKYIPICLSMLTQCDAVYLLEGSEFSKGTRVEFAYAKELKKRILAEKVETIIAMEEYYYYGRK